MIAVLFPKNVDNGTMESKNSNGTTNLVDSLPSASERRLARPPQNTAVTIDRRSLEFATFQLIVIASYDTEPEF